MTTECKACPLRRLSIFDDMSDDQVDFMSNFKNGELTVEAGSPILVEGGRSPQLFTVLRGLGLRYKTLEDGRRQVINFVMPGDFIGLQAAIGGEMGHSVEATTAMTLCVFRRSEIWTLFEKHPNRAYDITWLAATEEHFLGEALTSIGQRSAIERIAWGLVHLWERGRSLDLIENGSLPFPYRQKDLADTLGLSLVHTNKTLAKLRDRGLANWSDDRIFIHNLDKLRRLATMERMTEKRRPLL